MSLSTDSSPPVDGEDFERAMDMMFAGLHSTAIAVRAGTIADPWRFKPIGDFRPTCGRCGHESEPGTRRCRCGSWLVLRGGALR